MAPVLQIGYSDQVFEVRVDYEPIFGSREQHDAQECLSIFCRSETTGIANAFCATHGGAEHEGVLLCKLVVEAQVSGLAVP